MNEVKIKQYAPVVLRLGLVVVFVWFGLNQLMNQAMWTGLIPVWVVSVSGMSAKTIVIINGVFEIIASILLAFGIKVRLVATLLTLHLFGIVINLGLSANGVRDIGLMFGALSISLHGADILSFDKEGV